MPPADVLALKGIGYVPQGNEVSGPMSVNEVSGPMSVAEKLEIGGLQLTRVKCTLGSKRWRVSFPRSQGYTGDQQTSSAAEIA